MRFARRLHSIQDPRWEDAYIDYVQLKEQLKSHNAEDKESTTLTLLRSTEECVELFLRRQFQIVIDTTENLMSNFTASHTAFDSAQPAPHKECLQEISRFIVRLDLFAKVNRDIVRRILVKLRTTHDSELSQILYARPWLRKLAQLNDIVKATQEKSTAILDSYEYDIPSHTFPIDAMGRHALHYAAAYGHQDICVHILQSRDYTVCLQPDAFGDTPLLLAVLSGHASIVRFFLSRFPPGEYHAPTDLDDPRARLLSLAIESGHTESPLYRAARRGYGDLVKLLVGAGVDSNAMENTSQWTPLIVASVYGHSHLVKDLKAAGVNTTHLDRRGWSAVDHASYRGFPKIVEALGSTRAQPRSAIPSRSSTIGLQCPDASAPTVTLDRHTQGVQSNGDAELSHLFVNKYLPKTLPESDLFLEVLASECKEKYRIYLPITEDLDNLPWHFSTRAPDSVRLTFRISRSASRDANRNAVLCSGIALLKSLKGNLRQRVETVGRDHTISLVDESGTHAGDIDFHFLFCHPFRPESDIPVQQQMRSLKPTGIGGHRGMGQNNKNHENLQIGENTLQSFESATKLGADFIEFDVQVTKDLVPVIYHDFLVSETGTDAPMHTLSTAQFMELSRQQSAQVKDALSRRLPWDERARPLFPTRRRTQSLNAPLENGTHCLFERMEHTFEYKLTGLKGNTRSSSIHDPFITLSQLLESSPQSVHFDIELKYPMLFEMDDWKMCPYHMDLNLFTDTILQVLFKHGQDRHIFLSSFSPDLCIMLATKQKTYPVLFLNDSSNWPTGDPRALSLQSAVHFARRWELQGVIMASEPFISAPKLIKFVQDQRLFCASYGNLNDDPECAKIQADAGIDAIIVNKVNLITKVLRE
ncbi:hypothetical protein GRF29_216g334439 [Pseudopithomyces chartarum]|uniref:Uncharacterized protein n=1 Tax=Pseudopithomyces chartarum TaxID=1892770 RepID=A0AAN6LPL2_9PLEO|nr:hypothetical protein GRF29_216g334439 [Pseudopithomyces chartarum]